MSTHTAGPWFVTTDHTGKVATVYADSEGARVCTFLGAVPRNLGPDSIAANARLIAAAPDLLDALKAIVKSLADQDDEGLIEHAQPMIDARAAIKKATGEPA